MDVLAQRPVPWTAGEIAEVAALCADFEYCPTSLNKHPLIAGVISGHEEVAAVAIGVDRARPMTPAQQRVAQAVYTDALVVAVEYRRTRATRELLADADRRGGCNPGDQGHANSVLNRALGGSPEDVAIEAVRATPLAVAALIGDADAVRLLLSVPAVRSTVVVWDHQALRAAQLSGSLEVLRLLQAVDPATLDEVARVAQVVAEGKDWLGAVSFRLACGTLLPPITVKLSENRLYLGDESTGALSVGWIWRRPWLISAKLHSFFYTHHLTPRFRALLAERDPERSAPHLFMLLLDQLVVEVLRGLPTYRGFTVYLNDGVDLDTGPVSPFALRGRNLFTVTRDSRWLQWVRGAGYYATFGYWPKGETPQKYLARVARFARPGEVGTADPEALQVARQHKDKSVWTKAWPPVLPPTTAGGPTRRFVSIQAYWDQVLVPGMFGRVVPPTPGQTPSPTPSQMSQPWGAPSPVPIVLTQGLLEKLLVATEGHRGCIGNGVSVSWQKRQAGWAASVAAGPLTCRLWPSGLEVGATIEGAVGSDAALVVRLVSALAWQIRPGDVVVKWRQDAPIAYEYVVVGGTVMPDNGGGFVAEGDVRLGELGFRPVGMSRAQMSQNSAVLHRCQKQVGSAFLAAADPRFSECLRAVKRFSGVEWVLRVPREPARGVSRPRQATQQSTPPNSRARR